MKYLVLLSALLLASCQSPSSCEYEIQAKYLAATESEIYENVLLFQDLNSSSVFIVAFDTQKEMNTYIDYTGKLSLDSRNGVFVLCAD